MDKNHPLFFLAFFLFILIFSNSNVLLAQSALVSGTKFGDWVYECVAISQGKTNCALSQTIIAKETNQQIVKLNFLKQLDSKELSMLVLVPLGIDFKVGIAGTFNKSNSLLFQLETCIPNGCIGSIKIDEKLMASLKSESQLAISFKFKDIKDTTTVSSPLNGLIEGLKSANF